mmetsp:Transcript_23387/g.44001  ORF Transcript_23387/g.44001 Transcript_23387/m.44001 type:complete len:101 (+) Transcript_23387:98-400(+)
MAEGTVETVAKAKADLRADSSSARPLRARSARILEIDMTTRHVLERETLERARHVKTGEMTPTGHLTDPLVEVHPGLRLGDEHRAHPEELRLRIARPPSV